MAWDICIEIPRTPDPIELMLPGGISLKHTNLDALAQPALAPLGPVFKVIDAVAALTDVLTSLKDAFVPVFDPGAVATALGRVAAIPTGLATLAPPVAVPAMLAAILDLLLRTLGQLRGELAHLQQQAKSLVATENIAHRLGDARLLAVFECAKHNVEREAANVGQGMASVGHLLGVASTLGRLPGVNLTVPDMGSLSGQPLDAIIEPIDALIRAIGAARGVIPIPLQVKP